MIARLVGEILDLVPEFLIALFGEENVLQLPS